MGAPGPAEGQLERDGLPFVGGTVSSRQVPTWATWRKRPSVGFTTSGPSGTVRVRNATPGGGVDRQPIWMPWMCSSQASICVWNGPLKTPPQASSRLRPPSCFSRVFRSAQSAASWSSPPDTRPVLLAFSTTNGNDAAKATARNAAAAIAPLRQLPVKRSTSMPTPWSTRAPPMPPSTAAAAVDTIK